MKVGVQDLSRPGFFTDRWKAIFIDKGIEIVEVDFAKSNIVTLLNDCDIILWHFSHAAHPDYYLGPKLLAALANRKIVFPSPDDVWHFDDKIAQKYLFEVLGYSVPDTSVFYGAAETFKYLKTAQYPLVAKLKGGAGSSNVKLLGGKVGAFLYTLRSFTIGHRPMNRLSNFIFLYKQWIKGQRNINELVKSFSKIFAFTEFELYYGAQKGYVLFQQYLPGNEFDQRVVVIGGRAFAIKRYSNDGDFRASGAGNIKYDHNDIDPRCVGIAFSFCKDTNSRCLAFDFLYDGDKTPVIGEISYGFHQEAYDKCCGYWTSDLVWHNGRVEPQKWIVDSLIEEYYAKV